MTATRFTTIDSPVGTVTAVADSGGALCGVYLPASRGFPDLAGAVRSRDGVLEAAAAQLREYFDGRRREFDLELSPAGTEFQARVWRSLQDIPFGQTWSYSRLADYAGVSGAARAVGAANGRNPWSIVVPCHRVVGADGSLTGYGGGMEAKRALLEREGALAAA